jgi:hypothetical protein
MTIEEFIEARIAEDESVAKAATDAPWSYNRAKQWHDGADFETLTNGQEFVGYGGPSPFRGCIATTGDAGDPQSMADAEHIARHDPARVLRQCAALRLALEFWQGLTRLRTIAAIWSDHPDYREEWRS